MVLAVAPHVRVEDNSEKNPVGSEVRLMDYAQKFSAALNAIHREGRYRVFADLKRRRGAFPHAEHFPGEGAAHPITVWVL